MRPLDIALGEWGGPGGGAELREARMLVETRPLRQCAARALLKIGDVRRTCDGDAEGALEAAERAVRDLVVTRCGGGPYRQDREAFYVALEKAFGIPFRLKPAELSVEARELKALLSLAYHKLR